MQRGTPVALICVCRSASQNELNRIQTSSRKLHVQYSAVTFSICICSSFLLSFLPPSCFVSFTNIVRHLANQLHIPVLPWILSNHHAVVTSWAAFDSVEQIVVCLSKCSESSDFPETHFAEACMHVTSSKSCVCMFDCAVSRWRGRKFEELEGWHSTHYSTKNSECMIKKYPGIYTEEL